MSVRSPITGQPTCARSFIVVIRFRSPPSCSTARLWLKWRGAARSKPWSRATRPARAQEVARANAAVAPLRRALLRTILRVMENPGLIGVGTELLAVSGHFEGVAEVGTAVACQVVA